MWFVSVYIPLIYKPYYMYRYFVFVFIILLIVCVCIGTMDDHTRGIRLKPLGAMEGWHKNIKYLENYTFTSIDTIRPAEILLVNF